MGRPASSSSTIRSSTITSTNGSSSINASFKSAGGSSTHGFTASSSSRPSSASMTMNLKTTSTTTITTTKNKFSSFAAVGSAAFRPVTTTAPLVTIFSSLPTTSSNNTIPTPSGTSSTGLGCCSSSNEEGTALSTQPATKQSQIKMGHGLSNPRGAMAPTLSSTLATRPSIRERMLQQQQQQQQPPRLTTASRPTVQSPPYILKTKESKEEPAVATSTSTGYAVIVPTNVRSLAEPSSSSNIINGDLDI